MSQRKDIPVLFEKKEDCCGCGVCMLACPSTDQHMEKAISMVPDEEGFLYPRINELSCIRCYQCMQVCPIEKSR